MITLKHLAELSGYSIRTVKRVLDGHPHVNPEKRRIIMELAAENRYVPNMAARSLRTQKKNCAGILFEDFSGSAASRKLMALNAALLTCGFSPLLGELSPGREDECARMLAGWSGIAEYVIVFPLAETLRKNFFRELTRQYPLKFIFVDCPGDEFSVSVPVDRAGSVTACICRLGEMGCRHLCYCGSLPSRYDGVKAAAALMADKMKISIVRAGCEARDGEAAGAEIMASGAETVLLDTDRAAAGFYRYAAANRIAIPEDIGVVGFDNEDFAELLTPQLSSIAHPVEKIIDRICRIISGETVPEAPLAMEFIVRESLRMTKNS